jgi:hypothetical protein
VRPRRYSSARVSQAVSTCVSQIGELVHFGLTGYGWTCLEQRGLALTRPLSAATLSLKGEGKAEERRGGFQIYEPLSERLALLTIPSIRLR